MNLHIRNIYYLFFFYIILIIFKYYFVCDLFSDCSLQNISYDGKGDLGKYFLKFNSKINFDIVINSDSPLLITLYFLLRNIINFDTFLLIYLVVFYATLFLFGLKFFEKNYYNKFFLFLLVLIFYPFYQNYATHIPSQGLGIIFTFLFLIIPKKKYLLLSYFLILFSILSHKVFILFYLCLFVSRFFSVKLLAFIFSVCSIFILFDINFFFPKLLLISENFSLSIIPESFFLNLNSKINVNFLIFSYLPLFLLLFEKFRKIVFEEKLLLSLFKFHLLYTLIIFIFFSKYYYIDRFLSLTWIFYPHYFLNLLKIVK